jgi:hypothetical protein
MGDIVAIKRTNGSISTAKIIEMPVHYVQDGNTGVVIAKTDDKPVGTRVKGTKNIGYTAAPVYKVQILNDDLKTPTDQVKIVTNHNIVASMEPHLRGVRLLKMKSALPDDITMTMDEMDVDKMTSAPVDAVRNIQRLKLFMNKYRSYPTMLEKIKKKLQTIIMVNYRKSLHDGAHPEFIMNAFVYNPSGREDRFKVLRMDGNQVTVAMFNRDFQRYDAPTTIGLDAFLKRGISAKSNYGFWKHIPIGEVYGILPERGCEEETDDVYEDRINKYLTRLMGVFANKPSTELFSVPQSSAPIAPVSPTSKGRKTQDGSSRKRIIYKNKSQKSKKSKKSQKSQKSQKSKKH